MSAERNEALGESGVALEHRHPPAEDRVETPAPVASQAQPPGGDQLEESSTPAEKLPGKEIDLPVGNLPDEHSPLSLIKCCC